MQNSSMTWVWTLAVAIIIVGGGYYLWTLSGSSDTDTQTNTTTTTESTASENTATGSADGTDDTENPSAAAPMAATVTYTSSGFSPSTVTIRKGGTVTWINESGGAMWVASDEHPSHTNYSGTTRQQHCPDASGSAFDQCAAQTANYSFTFDKAGTIGYHDHVKASFGGTVVVVE